MLNTTMENKHKVKFLTIPGVLVKTSNMPIFATFKVKIENKDKFFRFTKELGVLNLSNIKVWESGLFENVQISIPGFSFGGEKTNKEILKTILGDTSNYLISCNSFDETLITIRKC